jgi:hypothetical protein
MWKRRKEQKKQAAQTLKVSQSIHHPAEHVTKERSVRASCKRQGGQQGTLPWNILYILTYMFDHIWTIELHTCEIWEQDGKL